MVAVCIVRGRAVSIKAQLNGVSRLEEGTLHPGQPHSQDFGLGEIWTNFCCYVVGWSWNISAGAPWLPWYNVNKLANEHCSLVEPGHIGATWFGLCAMVHFAGCLQRYTVVEPGVQWCTVVWANVLWCIVVEPGYSGAPRAVYNVILSGWTRDTVLYRGWARVQSRCTVVEPG